MARVKTGPHRRLLTERERDLMTGKRIEDMVEFLRGKGFEAEVMEAAS